jgi:tryptophan synthase alpha chain|tara:strand:- start:1134 stop:1940 length:807 start_codon:yes stop_codon:yes gene_type:complete
LSRLTIKVEANQTAGRKSLVAYIVAGDPVKDLTVKLMHAMVDAGVDIIELGFPFSDPEAEGPVIQLAHERALKHGTSLRDVLLMVEEFRQGDTDTPVILMGYLNPIELMGYEAFCVFASSTGVDGTIIVNLPPEESGVFSSHLENHDIDSVYLLAPTTTDKRAAYVTAQSRGFVYYVSLKGTTGASNLDVTDVGEKLSRFREISSLPVMVGFGIKDAATAAEVAQISDGVVVGSAIVNLIAKHENELGSVIPDVTELLGGIRKSLDKI